MKVKQDKLCVPVDVTHGLCLVPVNKDSFCAYL